MQTLHLDCLLWTVVQFLKSLQIFDVSYWVSVWDLGVCVGLYCSSVLQPSLYCFVSLLFTLEKTGIKKKKEREKPNRFISHSRACCDPVLWSERKYFSGVFDVHICCTGPGFGLPLSLTWETQVVLWGLVSFSNIPALIYFQSPQLLLCV